MDASQKFFSVDPFTLLWAITGTVLIVSLSPFILGFHSTGKQWFLPRMALLFVPKRKLKSVEPDPPINHRTSPTQPLVDPNDPSMSTVWLRESSDDEGKYSSTSIGFRVSTVVRISNGPSPVFRGYDYEGIDHKLLWYGRSDFRVFARTEMDRRKKLGIQSTTILVPEDSGE